MTEKQRSMEEHIANLIANSFFDDMYDWTHTKDINCYAFARGLTFPDPNHQVYTPGRIYYMKFGKGNYVRKENDPYFIDRYVMQDSIALEQNCKRVSFSTIKEEDGNFYFAITNFHMLNHLDTNHWHFICRTPSGIWLHKPNWIQNVQTINWIKYGENFRFDVTAREIGSSTPISPTLVTCEGICFEDYFYKLELPED